MSKKFVRWRNMNLPKVEKIELSRGNIILRVIAIGILIVIAAVCLGSALSEFFNTQPGWENIMAESDTVNCSADFAFNYDFTDYGGSASAAFKQLTSLYTQGCEDAFRIFSKDFAEDGLYNVAYLNSHVNEIITVDETLYEALALIEQYDSRHIYLAPVYVEYNRIFACDTAEEAVRFDPAQNPELVPYIQELVSYCNDPKMIHVELLGDNQVRLNVADEYLTYAEENALDAFIDFNWMTNAFIIDYLAELLTENGFTYGYISSYDGFTVNLDTRGDSYSLNLFNSQGDMIYIPAVLTMEEPGSVVFMRSYPLDDSDQWHFRDFGDNVIASVYIDPADGMSKSYYSNLVSYATDTGCAEILLQMVPSFIADEYNSSVFDAADRNVNTIWFDDFTLLCTQENPPVSLTESGVEAGYTMAVNSILN